MNVKRRTVVIAAAAACTIAALSYGAAVMALATNNHPSNHGLSESAVNDLLAHAPAESPQEVAALADGVVTLAEREAAQQAYLSCGEAAGYLADVYPASGQRITRTSFRVPGGADNDVSVRAAEAAFDNCDANVRDIEVIWAQELAAAEPSTSETAALYDRFDKCLATNGAAWIGDVPGFAMDTRVYKNASGRNILFPPSATPLTQFQCAAAEEAATGLAFPAPTGSDCITGKMGAGMSQADAQRFCPS